MGVSIDTCNVRIIYLLILIIQWFEEDNLHSDVIFFTTSLYIDNGNLEQRGFMLAFLGMFSGYLIYTITPHSAAVRRLTFSPCGSYLATASADCKGMVSCLLTSVKFGYASVKVYIKCFSCSLPSCKTVALRTILFDRM